MTDDKPMTEDELDDMFQIIRSKTDASGFPFVDGIEAMYRIERAQHELTKLRLMHAEAALDVVYGTNTAHSRRASDLRAV